MIGTAGVGRFFVSSWGDAARGLGLPDAVTPRRSWQKKLFDAGLERRLSPAGLALGLGPAGRLLPFGAATLGLGACNFLGIW